MSDKIDIRIDKNIEFIETTFKDCGDVVKRELKVGEHSDIRLYFAYIEALVDRQALEREVISTIMFKVNDILPGARNLDKNIFDAIKNSGISSVDLKESTDMKDVVLGILSGDTMLFIDGFEKVIILSTKSWPNRGIPTADTEVVIQGSKEAFSEVFRFNTVLVRRRIRDTNLKLIQTKVGTRSSTDIGIMYLEDVVRPEILKEVISRIDNINVDAIFDVGYIEQFIEDDYLSPFPQLQVTERPDKAAASILEGRIVIIVDNSPFVLIVPATFNVFFQSSEDYYQRFEIMSFMRTLRFVAGFIAFTLPGLYLAIALYHPSMISLDLILKMSKARETVPLPGLFEILLMDLSFELLREGGIRLPSQIGSSIGIVGGLIIGQAAVDAGLVSPIVVIVVAFTAVASFAIPSNALVASFRLSKYILIFCSAFFGFFGFCIGMLALATHLCALKSFGIPYLYPFVSGEINDYSDYKDTIFRLPIFLMKNRPFFANPNQKTRLKQSGNIREKE